MNILLVTYAKDHLALPALARLIEEAEKRGHDIKRVRYNDCSMSVENNQPTLCYRGERVHDVDAVIPWIIQGDFDYGIDVLRQFESMGAFLLNGSDAFVKANHKWRAAQVFAANGIPTPNTYYANHLKDMYRYIDEAEANEAIVKVSNGTKGRGVMLSNDKDTTKSMTAALAVSSSDYILQDFVRVSFGVDVRAYVVGGRVVAAMERRAASGFRSNLHLGGKGTPIHLSEEEIAIVVSAARALGLQSAGVDCMRTKQGLCVIEANASGGLDIENITSINIAGTIIEYIESMTSKGGA